MYVGSSVNLHNRIRRYLSLGHLHGIIGQALIKHGLDAFVLVLFFIPNATSSLLLSLEQAVLDGCVCTYNILPTAGSPAGVKRSEEHKAKTSASLKGHKHSDETKAKMSARKQGEANPNYGRPSPLKGQKLSEETKAKMSASKYNTGKAVYLYLVNTRGFELAASFPNIVRCSETLSIPRTTLQDRLKARTVFKFNDLQHLVSRDGNLA